MLGGLVWFGLMSFDDNKEVLLCFEGVVSRIIKKTT
jgi:hypothetical protein